MRTATPQIEPGANLLGAELPYKLRVVVADASASATNVVLALLEFHETIDVIGRAANFDETIQLIVNHKPDLVMIDLDMHLANLTIPAMALSSSKPVSIVGLCFDHTISSRQLDCLAQIDALVHRSRLRHEFPLVMEALYGSVRVSGSVPPSADSMMSLPRWT
jgi:CheY-like chemotaxis protein